MEKEVKHIVWGTFGRQDVIPEKETTWETYTILMYISDITWKGLIDWFWMKARGWHIFAKGKTFKLFKIIADETSKFQR